MKYVLIMLLLTSCGYTARNSEFIGQIKYVEKRTPLICPDYWVADVSLGVIKNGSGSVSSHDTQVQIINMQELKKWQDLNSKGSIVKIQYDKLRISLCFLQLQSVDIEEIK